VRSKLRVAGIVILASVGVFRPAWAAGPSTSPDPSAAASEHPIRDEADRAAEAVFLAHLKPCLRAEHEGLPCFPVSVEEEGPRFSVAGALQGYRGVGSPAPGPPTLAETQARMPAVLHSASGGPSFDPVCAVKGLVRKLSGKATDYYLYRTWGSRGEQPLLTDRPLDPKAYAKDAAFHYELVGKFGGECAAVAAWRLALRQAAAPAPLAAAEWRRPADPKPASP